MFDIIFYYLFIFQIKFLIFCVCSQMNNLKKILQTLIDYYNEVGCGHVHNIFYVFAVVSWLGEPYVHLFLVGVLLCTHWLSLRAWFVVEI